LRCRDGLLAGMSHSYFRVGGIIKNTDGVHVLRCFERGFREPAEHPLLAD
jgi:hypothetical protein